MMSQFLNTPTTHWSVITGHIVKVLCYFIQHSQVKSSPSLFYLKDNMGERSPAGQRNTAGHNPFISFFFPCTNMTKNNVMLLKILGFNHR